MPSRVDAFFGAFSSQTRLRRVGIADIRGGNVLQRGTFNQLTPGRPRRYCWRLTTTNKERRP
jgi:hypothetical protein